MEQLPEQEKLKYNRNLMAMYLLCKMDSFGESSNYEDSLKKTITKKIGRNEFLDFVKFFVMFVYLSDELKQELEYDNLSKNVWDSEKLINLIHFHNDKFLNRLMNHIFILNK